MLIFSALGAIALVGLVAIAVVVRRRRADRLVAAPRDIVFMEEAVLSDFLSAEYERNLERAKAAPPPPPPPPEPPVAVQATTTGQTTIRLRPSGVETTLNNGERVIPSMSGGVTAVAGPPTDLADEGWARDPNGRHEWRYFDGDGWSDFVLDGDNVDTDPITISA